MAGEERDVLKEQIRHAKYKVKQELAYTQRYCPGCGEHIHSVGDAHHTFLRRTPDKPEYYTPMNIILVHNKCHVPESKTLNIKCALEKLKRYTPQQIETWAEKMGQPLPSWYWEAKEQLYGQPTD